MARTAARMILLALCGLVCSAMAGEPAAPAKAPALIIPLDQVKIEIANVKFEVEVQGVDGPMRVPEDKRDKFRLALVTLRIRKPAGMKLTFAGADLTFHYYHGSDPEVAPAEGISGFTTSIEDFRPLKLWQSVGGCGWIKQTTNPRVSEAAEIYLDALFYLIEPNIRECWIGVAQPVQQAPFVTKGWTPGN